MSRYIDADEALRMMRNSREDNPCDYTQRGAWNIAHDCCISCLDAVPTADVVEVVRCKDCKYFTIDKGDSLGYCTCQKIPMNFVGELYPEEYFYCSYGERREENER